MKALTLTQPWATLVAVGAKQYETRSWSTRYRGPLAIHAAKGFPGWAKTACLDEPFYSVLTADRGETQALRLPLGMVVAVAVLAEVLPVGPGRLFPAQLSDRERAFGDYSDGRYAWVLRDIEPLPQPVPAKGALGLWDWQL
jgi:hypothetical protein